MHNISTFTGFLSDFFKQKNEKLHNQLPPHLAAKSIRYKAEERKRQAPGELYRQSLLMPTYEHLKRTQYSQVDTFRMDTYPTPSRSHLALAIHQRAVEEEAKDRLPHIPVTSEITLEDGLDIEVLLLQAIESFEKAERLIPTSINVCPTRSLQYPTTSFAHLGINIPIVPALELDRNTVRCVYFKEMK